MVCAALVIAGVAYSMFPLVQQVPYLIALSFLLGLGMGTVFWTMSGLLLSGGWLANRKR